MASAADLTPDRRLHASGGQARSLYAELAKNLSTRTKPDGGALAGIVEKFIFNATTEAKAQNAAIDAVIHGKLDRLSEMVNGYDFAQVIEAYWRAHAEGNQELKTNAIRWLRGEFTSQDRRRNALGVRTIMDDASFYDQTQVDEPVRPALRLFRPAHLPGRNGQPLQAVQCVRRELPITSRSCAS